MPELNSCYIFLTGNLRRRCAKVAAWIFAGNELVTYGLQARLQSVR